jgi:hypothetical protein
MIVPKNDLLKILKTLALFDPKGSPYIGVQLGSAMPSFYRSSALGYIQSNDFGDGGTTHVSLAHFINSLKNMPEDSIQLSLDGMGVLCITGTDDQFKSDTHVHTVAPGQAGLKKHDIGEPVFPVDKNAFAKINVKPFKMVTPPVLVKGRLMLATDAGATIIWNGPEFVHNFPEVYPREGFLYMVCDGAEVKNMTVTTHGYWGAEIEDFTVYTKGHDRGRQIFNTYTSPGQEIGRLPAKRLMDTLDSAVGLLEPAGKVEIDPKTGLSVKGKFGNSQHSLGEGGNWPKFGMLAKTAKVISDALSQTFDDDAVLFSVPTTMAGVIILRLKRGPFEVNFRAY